MTGGLSNRHSVRWPYANFLPTIPNAGKTRFLLTLGSICYRPIFASAASTVSPLFRLLDSFRGTLILDEGDFRYSDEKSEVVKILNNGNAPQSRSRSRARFANRDCSFDARQMIDGGGVLIVNLAKGKIGESRA